MIGYCAEGDQRLLVYEYMPMGSLESHLHGKVNAPFSFYTSKLLIATSYVIYLRCLNPLAKK
jgi:hypothetical protein